MHTLHRVACNPRDVHTLSSSSDSASTCCALGPAMPFMVAKCAEPGARPQGGTRRLEAGCAMSGPRGGTDPMSEAGRWEKPQDVA